MAAFGAAQGGKDKAYESQPKSGHVPTPSENPDGCKCEPVVDSGHGGTKKGFGA